MQLSLPLGSNVCNNNNLIFNHFPRLFFGFVQIKREINPDTRIRVWVLKWELIIYTFCFTIQISISIKSVCFYLNKRRDIEIVRNLFCKYRFVRLLFIFIIIIMNNYFIIIYKILILNMTTALTNFALFNLFDK